MNIFRNLFKKERVLSINDIASQIYEYAEENIDPYAYIEGLYVDNDGNSFAILAASGKLKKFSYSIANGKVVDGGVTDVVIDFTPVSQSRVKIVRTSENESLWYGIVASAVLNRNAEIDTTKMFDYLEENYRSGNAYLTFHHLPKDPFQFGTVEGVFRYNEFLIGYGKIDTSTALGKAAERSLESGEWGFSIGFMSNEGKMVDINGIKIRTFEIAELIEVSILKESNAANLFTQANYKERYSMATKERAKDLLMDFLNDEEEADNLIEQADFKSREIHENGLITREDNKPEAEEQNENENGDGKMELVLTEETLEVIGRAAKTDNTELIAAINGLGELLKTHIETTNNKFTALEERAKQEDEQELNKPFGERQRSVRPTEKQSDGTVKLTINDTLKERLEATRVK